jgi:hypothetical protein
LGSYNDFLSEWYSLNRPNAFWGVTRFEVHKWRVGVLEKRLLVQGGLAQDLVAVRWLAADRGAFGWFEVEEKV